MRAVGCGLAFIILFRVAVRTALAYRPKEIVGDPQQLLGSPERTCLELLKLLSTLMFLLGPETLFLSSRDKSNFIED